jgi:two-component system response regulator FixJ
MPQLEDVTNQSPEANQQTVFVVDDDEGARQSITALVKSRGMHVSGFASAREFLDKYNPSWHGCLVSDVRMEGMSGLELLEEMKRRKINMPVIVISGYADIPVAVKAMRNGAVSFLEKPCFNNELWQEIMLALDQERSQAAIQDRLTEIERDYATLTAGELQVLEKILAGEPNKTIAMSLDMGLRTVEMRRANILKKMHANSLAELIRMIVQIRPA